MNLFLSSLPVLFCIGVEPMPQLPKPMSPADFLRQCEAQEKALFEYFSNDKVWDRENRDMTVSQLAVVAKLKPLSVLPILLKRITYYDTANRDIALGNPEETLPVYGALAAYGSLSNPALFEHLRSFINYKETIESKREDYIYYMLLCNPNQNSKCQKVLAEQTIQCEIEKQLLVKYPRLLALLKIAETEAKK